MDQANFCVQGEFKGGADVGHLAFYFSCGPDHVLWTPERYPPPGGIGTRWVPDESIYAITGELPRKTVQQNLSGPGGYLRPGDYDVTFESYDYFSKKPHSTPIRTTGDERVRGVITVEYEGGENKAHCQIRECAITDLLSSLILRAGNHKNLRLPDRDRALMAMFQFIDPAGVQRCGIRHATALKKLLDHLQLKPDSESRQFRQVFHRFDFNSFRERIKNPSAHLAFFELRAWLSVEDDTLHKWLIESELPPHKFHGRSYTCTVKDFLDRFVPFLIPKIDTSPAGDKIAAALNKIDLAP